MLYLALIVGQCCDANASQERVFYSVFDSHVNQKPIPLNKGPAPGGVRYAMGGGLRMTLINFDVTAGYSWNLHRRAGEGKGAFVLTMDISNLFR
jgi:hypothetical protein